MQNISEKSSGNFRYFMLIMGFMMTEAVMVAYMTELPKYLLYIYAITFGVFAAVDLFFFIPDPHSFVQMDGRMCYYATKSPASTLHQLFLVFIAVTMIAIAIVWAHREKRTRQVYFIRVAFISNLAILVSILPDTILPLFGQPSFPSSFIGMFITYMCIWYYAARFNAFSITVNNLSQYIFESANTAILIFDEEFQLSLANDYSRQLLKIESIDKQEQQSLYL